MRGIMKCVKTWLIAVRGRWDRGRFAVSSMGMRAEVQKMAIVPVEHELFGLD